MKLLLVQNVASYDNLGVEVKNTTCNKNYKGYMAGQDVIIEPGI